MDRRTFIAAIPATTLVPAVARAQAKPNPGPGQGGAAPADAPPQFWPEGAERFLRPDVHAGDRPVGASFASRSAVYGMNGAAGTAHPLATQAGIDILKAGGSAVDAAIAINACLGFLEPTSSGIGGDCYAMVWDPKAKKVVGLAGSGPSPRGLSLETVRSRAKNGVLPPLGAVTVSVPGAVDAWWTLHQRYGKLPWAQVLAPAIALADEGAPVPDIIAYYIRRSMAAFARPGTWGSRRLPTRSAPMGLRMARDRRAGQVFRNPDLARTYRIDRRRRSRRVLQRRHRAGDRPLLQADRRLAGV